MKVTIVAEKYDGSQPERFGWRVIGRLVGYHLYAIIDHFPDEGEAVIVLDPSSTGLRVFPASRADVGAEIQEAATAETFEIEVEHPIAVKFHWFELLTCVTMVKRIIGLNRWWVLTPRQLMRELDGARTGSS